MLLGTRQSSTPTALFVVDQYVAQVELSPAQSPKTVWTLVHVTSEAHFSWHGNGKQLLALAGRD